MAKPVRVKVEPGIFRRVNDRGQHLGFEIRWKDANGASRRRSVQGDIHAARDALAQARVRRARREIEPLDPRVTFSAVCDEYERVHVASLRAGSQGVRKAALRRLRKRFGSRRITQIGRTDVRRWVNDLAAERTANTVLAYYSTMRAVFNFAASDLDLGVTFPALKSAELPDPAEDEREKRIVSDKELAVLLAACEPRCRLYFRTVAETGCRASEALGLTPRRIGDGAIEFVKQLGRDGALRPLKSRYGRRTVEASGALTAQLRLAGRDRTFEPLTLRLVEAAWREALERARLEDPQPRLHDLRHSHASRLIAAGWDPVEVAKRLGDRVETVLSTYAHEWDAQRRSKERRAAIEGMYGDIMLTTVAEVIPLR